ncbi:hypothetical protein M1403_00830 [Patescibacteria group bacterium]|nr:hypothetical protein [Patescibacteria group bacterium]
MAGKEVKRVKIEAVEKKPIIDVDHIDGDEILWPPVLIKATNRPEELPAILEIQNREPQGD